MDDLTGLAALVSAVGVFIVACAQAYIIVASRKRDATVAKVIETVEHTKDLVNAKMEEQKKMIEQLAYAAGLKAGIAQERGDKA